MAAVIHFFGREKPRAPEEWPTVTLLQPVTRGATDLFAALEARAKLDYSAHLQHLLVCDAGDDELLRACESWVARHSSLDTTIVEVAWEGRVAAKTEKLQAGLAHATGKVVCCVDDDIILRSDSLRTMIPYLCERGVGATFGLACYTDWSNLPSSLMSGFVNANALLTYVPGTYLAEPFTITGHIFAVRRDVLQAVDGFAGLEKNIADDHLLAAKLRKIGLLVVQTPMIYDVKNHLATLGERSAQMKRWFVFPRQALIPIMSPGEQLATLALGVGNIIPGVLGVLALLARRRGTVTALARSVAAFNIVYSACEVLYLKRVTPVWWRGIVALEAIVSPLQIVWALLSDDKVEWRGRKLRILRGGDFEETL